MRVLERRGLLERRCRYITRPPFATKRLSVDGQGRVVYQYKQAFRDGSTQMALESLPTYKLSQWVISQLSVRFL